MLLRRVPNDGRRWLLDTENDGAREEGREEGADEPAETSSGVAAPENAGVRGVAGVAGV